ncbi:hypothetical protein KAX29_04915 [candidate division WOR-3 bacterium]|nr:hypothetical protein [candidate division WOR-3 bacterium]
MNKGGRKGIPKFNVIKDPPEQCNLGYIPKDLHDDFMQVVKGLGEKYKAPLVRRAIWEFVLYHKVLIDKKRQKLYIGDYREGL